MSSFLANPVYADYVRLTNFADRPVQTLEACVAELKSLGVVSAVISGRDIESAVRTSNSNSSTLSAIRAYPTCSSASTATTRTRA
jgi:type II secretory pathway component PulK